MSGYWGGPGIARPRCSTALRGDAGSVCITPVEFRVSVFRNADADGRVFAYSRHQARYPWRNHFSRGAFARKVDVQLRFKKKPDLPIARQSAPNRERRTLLKPILFVKQRFEHRPDAEHIQVLIRLGIVSTSMVYFHSAFFANNAANAEYVLLARWAVSIAFIITLALFVAVVVWPGVSVARRIVGLIHDVVTISTAMFLGEAGAAAVAAIYLWVTLGNGFRYGIAYLYGCAILSIVGFGAVFMLSDYWHEQRLLSINILILLALIPPYVGGLLKSLREAEALLKQRASFDGLTGLMNRVEFEQNIAAILASRQNGHFMLFCDLDHFKAVNDSAGHAAGDKLLADVGQIIQECVRHDDLTARLGGDEFAVFLKNCPQDRVRAIAESIRSSISGYRLAWSTDYYSVGVSVGAAPSAAVKDIESLFRLADAACYAAKNAGRNQIHVIDARACVEDTQSIRSTMDNASSASGNSARIGATSGRTAINRPRR